MNEASNQEPTMPVAKLRALVRTVPDFPKAGIQFRDVTTLIADAAGFAATIEHLAQRADGLRIDMIAGIEARGFIFGAALAVHMGVGFLPIRKPGKLPGVTIGQNYDLEYGSDRVEIHADAVRDGMHILLVDDLIATGGTALAAAALLRSAGARIEHALFVVDLPDIGGAERLAEAGLKVTSLMEFEGD